MIRTFLVYNLLLQIVYSVPNYWGCQEEVAKGLPYCDPSLSIDERLQDLISRLTIQEKIGMISPDPSKDTCSDHAKAVPRLGIPEYMWLTETNTAVNSACIRPGKCSTQFSGPLTIGASFNRTSWYLKGSVFGTEQRALMNLNWKRKNVESNDYIGLTAYGPNINQPRDPRFGRYSELPSEDPFHAGMYAAYMVRGMQEKDSNGHPKILAYLKHFTAYNRETDRGVDDYNISTYDLFDTYLPQFEMGMKVGQATGVMCSYNAVNGRPSCANGYLLNAILRERWNRPDAHVTTDCGAIFLLNGPPAYAPDNATAAAWALLNGTDVEMASTIWGEYMVEAIERGLVSEKDVDRAFSRSYRPHFVAGRFDDPSQSEWYKFGLDDIQSAKHQQIQLEAALQGLVLLKNEDGILPIKPGTKVTVVGPLGQTRAGLMSDYENDQSCFGGGHDCIPTLYESIREVNGPLTTNASGVDIDSLDVSGVRYALNLVEDADIVVLCVGITKAQEREGIDRNDTALPGLQETFTELVFEIGKPVIMVLVNGGPVAIDNLVEYPSAIIEAFNPNSIGGTALALSLFGLENRWGKLPYTIYPHSVMQAFDMKDHSMTDYPGRSYRYFVGDPVFPFGYGLSLTTFSLSCLCEAQKSGVSVGCKVTNTGTIAGDEVIQVYHSVKDRVQVDHPVPFQSLIGFDRVRVERGRSIDVAFLFRERSFMITNTGGEKVLYPAIHKLIITNGNMEQPIECTFEMPPRILEASAI